MSYPRLIEKFGKRYSWKMMLNPTSNIRERCHAVVGECHEKARETYFKGWKRSLRDRLKPKRASPLTDLRYGIDIYEEPGKSNEDPLLSQKVAGALSRVRQPQLTDFIKVGGVVGAGVEGVVRPGIHNGNDCSSFHSKFAELASKFGNRALAVKTIEKIGSSVRGITAKEYREVKVLQKLSKHVHPNITSYLHTFESPIRLHIVSEYNQGGDLFSFLSNHDFEQQTEPDAARVMMQLFSAVLYCHEQGLVHLDLKVENIMRRLEGEHIDEGGVRLIDFGHTSPAPDEGEVARLTHPVGSASYASPEVVLHREYTVKSDAWSLGVIMYILLQGYLPFPHLQEKKWREFSLNDYGNFNKGIEEHDPFFYDGDWEDISPAAKKLCQSLLQVDPDKRLSVAEAISHPWFKENFVGLERTKDGVPVMKLLESEPSSVAESFSWI